MHVQAENEKGARELLQLFDDLVVADTWGKNLVLLVRKGMRAGGGNGQAYALRGADQLAAYPKDFIAQLRYIAADLCPDLDDRFVHLPLDLSAEPHRSRREQFRDVGSEVPGLWIDDLELLLHADGKPVGHGRSS
jgi:hypothetical protein